LTNNQQHQSAHANLERSVAERTAELQREIAERIRAEQAVRESQALYHSLVEQLPNGIFRKDAAGRYVLVNTRFCQLKGMQEHEFLGKTARELLAYEMTFDHPRHAKLSELLNLAVTQHETIMQTGQPIEQEEEWPGADGKPRYFQVVKSPVFGPDGKIVGTQGILFDITQRRQAEAAMRESQALYHSLVEQMPTGVFRKDAAGRYVFVNSWYCRLKRMSLAEILGRTPKELADYELACRRASASGPIREHQYALHGDAHHVAIMQTGAQIEVEEEYPGEAGDIRYLHVVKFPIFDPGGKITGSQGMLFDVTQRKQAMDAVAASEDRFRSVWERSIEGLRLTDREGRVVDVNDAFCKLVQLPREKVVGHIFSVTYKGHGPSDTLDVYKKRFDTGTIISRIETRVELWNSGQVEVEISSSFIEFVQQGKMMLSIFRDVTERKRTEEQLRKAQADLVQTSRYAGMAEVATNVLHNVGNVLNSVTVSAGVIAEKLRAPKATGIRRVVELLEKNRADLPGFFAAAERGEQVRSYLNLVADQLTTEQGQVVEELQGLTGNIEHIKEIVTMQQSYARVAGVTELQFLPALVEDAVRMHAEALVRHQVKIIRNFDALPQIPVDKHKILQILVNLISNAKYALSHSQSAERLLTLRIKQAGVNRPCIAVADNGIGIAPENLTRIFSHGFTTRHDGHGFGLHSSALAAREMGGALRVESNGLGHGATFILELPAPTGARDVAQSLAAETRGAF
jgi:PAS domain S-box-containing protein